MQKLSSEEDGYEETKTLFFCNLPIKREIAIQRFELYCDRIHHVSNTAKCEAMIIILSEYIADPIELRKQCSNSSFNSTDRSFSLSTITVVICVCRFRTNRRSICNCGYKLLCSYLNRNVSSKG
jgi:hypothetical protein